MKIFFLMPFVASMVAAWYMVFCARGHLLRRITVTVVVLVAAVLQVLDWFDVVSVYFLIPLLTQIIVTIGVYFYSELERLNARW